MSKIGLTESQVAQYERDGFTVCPDFLSSDNLAAMSAEIDTISQGHTLADHDSARLEMEPNQPPDGSRVRRIYDPGSRYPLFVELSESPRLLDCLEQLIGPNIYFASSKLNMKPPEIGSVVEWHQDFSYGPRTNPDSLAVLVYLDDVDRENGCLQIMPGYHKRGLLDHTHEGFFQGRITEELNTSEVVDIEGSAGTAIFMHCLSPHASSTNRSERPRRTLILSYLATDSYPIYCGEMTHFGESNRRLVRGEPSRVARFELKEIAIPCYEHSVVSLYEIQSQYQEEESGSQ